MSRLTYSEHYHSETELIETNERMIKTHADMVDEAVEKYQEHGPPTHMLDEMAPETEHSEADAIEEGVQEDAEHSILCPEGQPNLRFTSDPLDTPTRALAVELIPEFLSDQEYRNFVQSLNSEQRTVFQYLLNWCHAKADSPTKNTVRAYLCYWRCWDRKVTSNIANFTFRKAGQNPSQIPVLLMTPIVCLFVLFELRLNVPVNNFQSCRDGATASWVINQYFRGVKCLAQGHNTAAVGFEPPTSRSGVQHSTTEPPRSPTPTVTAAFNIGASTIHSLLPLPKNLKTYIKLSDGKCSTLRVKLQSLQMISIDEITLVGSDMPIKGYNR